MQYQCGQRGCIVEAEAPPENCPICGNPFVPVDDALPRSGDGDTLLERSAPPVVAAAAAAVAAELELEARIDALTLKVAELEHILANQAQALELQVSLAERRNGELDELTRRVDARWKSQPADDGPLAALDATGG